MASFSTRNFYSNKKRKSGHMMPRAEVLPEFQQGQRGIEIDGHDSELARLLLQIRLEETQERKLKMQFEAKKLQHKHEEKMAAIAMEKVKAETEAKKSQHEHEEKMAASAVEKVKAETEAKKSQHEHEEKMAASAVEKVKAETEAKKSQHEHEEKMATLALETFQAEAEKCKAETELLKQRNEEQRPVEEESFLERLCKTVSAILVGIWNTGGDYWGKLKPVLIEKLVEETMMWATKVVAACHFG